MIGDLSGFRRFKVLLLRVRYFTGNCHSDNTLVVHLCRVYYNIVARIVYSVYFALVIMYYNKTNSLT